MEKINPDNLTLIDKVVAINRVVTVSKGGKRFSFRAMAVVGDQNGHVGAGKGKANEVPEAIRKAVESAKKRLIKVPLKGSTIPHDVHGKFGGEVIVMRPAPEGRGVIAGGAVRAIMEVLGVKDIVGKCLGRGNPYNVVQATMAGLKMIKDPETVMHYRFGKPGK